MTVRGLGDFRNVARIKEVGRGVANTCLLRLRGSFSDPSETLVISGHFRSGTTWLAELVASIANAGIIFEPLHIQHVREARRLGLKWQNLHLPDELWPEGQEYVGRVLSGKVLNGWTTSHIPLRRVFEIDRWVVKFVCANQMLGWIARNFQVPKPVLLIRHPCAVLASRIARGWTLYRTLSNKDEFLRAYPEKAHCFGVRMTREESFALKWCMDHYSALSVSKPYPFHILFYERLVTEGMAYLEPVLADWGLSVPTDSEALLRAPSAKASGSIVPDAEALLEKWKHVLTVEQVQQVLRIMQCFGLGFYTDDVQPHYEQLAP